MPQTPAVLAEKLESNDPGVSWRLTGETASIIRKSFDNGTFLQHYVPRLQASKRYANFGRGVTYAQKSRKNDQENPEQKGRAASSHSNQQAFAF
jgi:hypothetical protein